MEMIAIKHVVLLDPVRQWNDKEPSEWKKHRIVGYTSLVDPSTLISVSLEVFAYDSPFGKCELLKDAVRVVFAKGGTHEIYTMLRDDFRDAFPLWSALMPGKLGGCYVRTV